jgi:hypothetical protein
VLVTVGRDELLAELAQEGAPDSAYWVILLVVTLVGGMIAAALKFLFELRGIVKSVDRGDPFEPANADRLSRMGWLMVAAYAIGIVAGVAVSWLQRVVPEARGADIDINGDGGGSILLILVLFILARVFRQGARMREELEGTV